MLCFRFRWRIACDRMSFRLETSALPSGQVTNSYRGVSSALLSISKFTKLIALPISQTWGLISRFLGLPLGRPKPVLIGPCSHETNLSSALDACGLESKTTIAGLSAMVLSFVATEFRISQNGKRSITKGRKGAMASFRALSILSAFRILLWRQAKLRA